MSGKSDNGDMGGGGRLDIAEGSLLELVIRTAPDGLIIIDEKGIVQSFSPAASRMFGYKAEEVLGRNVSMLMPEDIARKHDQYLARHLEGRGRKPDGSERELMARKKNGVCFPIELTIGEIDNQGQLLFTGFIRDLSQHRFSEQQISRLQDRLVHES